MKKYYILYNPYAGNNTGEKAAKKIQEILPQVLREHAKNAREIDYLYNYYNI